LQGYTVFSIPVGVVYRPNSAKVKNLKAKDYLGKARLVATSDLSNAYTGFAGPEIKNVSAATLTENIAVNLNRLGKRKLRTIVLQKMSPLLQRIW
jgi:hypothetical protein